MLDDLQPLPDSPAPQAGDEVTLRPGAATVAGAVAGETLIVADIEPELGGALLLNRPADHPGYWDWAAYADPADVHTVTRFGTSPAHCRTWTLPTP
ncbi:DUF6211 family protein [Streptomyces celluloflavus]|uniref:DUF6211 family protein n=1 Tax=Streptomyces celluloflavus TaxID=58344 RepID=UPI00368AD381